MAATLGVNRTGCCNEVFLPGVFLVVPDPIAFSVEVQGPLPAQRNPAALASGDESAEDEGGHRRTLDQG